MIDAFQVHVSCEWPDLPLPRSNCAVTPRFLQAPYVVTPPRLPLLMPLVLTPKSYESGQLLYQAGANVLASLTGEFFTNSQRQTLPATGDAAFHMYLVLSGTFAFVARPERPSKSPRANVAQHHSYLYLLELTEVLSGCLQDP